MEPLPPKMSSIDSARAQFIGLVLNWGLYGLLISQTYTYYVTFQHDARINKAIVCSVFLLETVQTVLLTNDMYHVFVLNPGDVELLENIGLVWLAVPVLGGMVGWIAEIFYANRIFKISRSRKVSGIIVVLSFVQLAAALMAGVQAHSVQSYVVLRSSHKHRPMIWVVSMTTCDVIIAITMTYYLVQLKREFHESSHIIRKLVTLAIETGTVTALAAISSGVLFTVWPDSESFNITGFILGKLYANSLLRVLNSRNRTEYTGDIITFPLTIESSHNTQHHPCQARREEGQNF